MLKITTWVLAYSSTVDPTPQPRHHQLIIDTFVLCMGQQTSQ